MLAVAPVGKKTKPPSIISGLAPISTDNFEVKSANDDFAISNNGELEMFKRTTNGGQGGFNNNQQPNSGGREDPRNIVGDVFVGKKMSNRSPANYQ